MSGAAEWTGLCGALRLSARSAAMTEAEFHDFYRDTARGLKQYLMRLVGDGALAEDLFQESYLRMLRVALPEMDASQRKNYLYRTATNLARDEFRRKGKDPVSLEGQADPPAAEANLALGADMSRILEAALPRERALLWLAYVEGASHREIAEVTGLKEASIRPMLYRARQKVGALLRASGWGRSVKQREPVDEVSR
jgi:RNA polymerase sigma-70 factor (ECF subfamily)